MASKISMMTLPLAAAVAGGWMSLYQQDLTGQKMRAHTSAPLCWWDMAPVVKPESLVQIGFKNVKMQVLERRHLLMGRRLKKS